MRFLRETNDIPVVVAQFLPTARLPAIEIETTGDREDQRFDYRYEREHHHHAQLLRKCQRARPRLLTGNDIKNQ